jgi:hypothetical protein
MCADAASPKQWANIVTRQQLPVARPPAWSYRANTTAIKITNTLKGRTFLHGEYITAQVRGFSKALPRYNHHVDINPQHTSTPKPCSDSAPHPSFLLSVLLAFSYFCCWISG